MSSNKRGEPKDKEAMLAEMQAENERLSLMKVMTLIAHKLDEKFSSIAKAFRFFDKNNNQLISKTEFDNGIENMRIKLPKADIDRVFKHLDQDGDGHINYKEFCGFTEEKRRGIDPFDSEDNRERFE